MQPQRRDLHLLEEIVNIETSQSDSMQFHRAQTLVPVSSKALGLLVAVALVTWLSTASTSATQESLQAPAKQQESARKLKLPKLYDFATYKRLFDKHYSGLAEELVRQKYFLARAFRAIVSTVKYTYRNSRFYLAVNHLSDWTPQELKLLSNKRREGGVQGASATAEVGDLWRRAIQHVDGRLEGPASEQAPMSSLKESQESKHASSARRRKRSVVSKESLKSNELPSDKLINTRDLADQREELFRWFVIPNPSKDRLGRLTSSQEQAQAAAKSSSLFDWDRLSALILGTEQEKREPDEVFEDLRRTGCFFLPRDQGKCGSCYAFATIAMLEFLYCQIHGDLVPFSEQYIVDCGKGRFKDSGGGGCNGGSLDESATFVHNFGLELRTNYPYKARELPCPYSNETDLKSTGYVRAELTDVLVVPLAHWPPNLKRGPLYVDIIPTDGFHEYGGGVHNVACKSDADRCHAMVVIGHGREEGLEYWLVRNSHGVGWGEGGYYKLAKEADCVIDREGRKLGAKDELTYSFALAYNTRHNPEAVMRHYVRNSGF